MSEPGKREAVDNTFKVIELMEGLRDIFRETSPTHKLNSSCQEEAQRLIGKAREALDKMENEITML